MIARLEAALLDLTERIKRMEFVAGVILFGSYARGEHGLKSDVDLLILFSGIEHPETTEAGRDVLRAIGEVEAAHRLPMHLAPILASVDRPEELGNDLIHSLWADGIVLFAEAGALARLRPEGLSPFSLIRFSLAGAPAVEKVRLSRRLHGRGAAGSALGLGSLVLGPGVLLVPASRTAHARSLLDEVGATYDVIDIWR